MANKVYAPKPPAGPVERALGAAAPNRRAHLKAMALVVAAEKLPRTFAYGDLEITIVEGPTMAAEGLLRVSVSATRAGVPVHVDNPYLFLNPPVTVPDGTWRSEGDQDFTNFREDATEALKAIIGQAVASVGGA